MPYDIPFNRIALAGREREHMADAVARSHISGDGFYSQRCHDFLQTALGVPKALLTTSCTHALEMAAMLLDIREGDEVIVPSYTFVSTINAFVLRGARPVFCDIRPDTLNLDEALLPSLISPRTKAIVPVHYAGIGCDLDAILAAAVPLGIPVVEDNAHGLFGKYKDRWLGTFGALASLSFHETKNFQCGEGGALLINNADLADRAEIIREKGTNRSRFFRGMVDKYTWVDIGSSHLPSDLLAAYLFAQFEVRDRIQAARQAIWEGYQQGLAAWAANLGVRLPFVPADCTPAYHLFYVLMPSLEKRDGLIAHLKARSILAVFHYLPLHASPMGRQFGGRPGDCPVTERVSDGLLRLPFYTHLSRAEQDRVVNAIRDYRW